MKTSVKGVGGVGGAVMTLLMAAGILLTAGPTAPAQGQGVGVYRGRQGRRVGGMTLPTPPFNPDASVLDRRGVGRRGSPKAAPRRSTGRGVEAANRNPARVKTRRRAVRRGRNVRHKTPRKSVVNQ
jgi:hypothetical protein